jgi:thiamine pyrophosphokinase
MSRIVAIMGNGPLDHLPDLSRYTDEVDVWIGADRGALTLVEHGITVSYAVGDFDSIDADQRRTIEKTAVHFEIYPVEKDQTDMEIALQKAFELQPEKIYLFGVTGGRLDHALINIQLLYTVTAKKIRGIIADKWNRMEMTTPGTHIVEQDEHYPYISFVPLTQHVEHLSLKGFYYPLKEHDISWGSTRCISNKLLSNSGTFSYKEGILLLIKSCDATSNVFSLADKKV